MRRIVAVLLLCSGATLLSAQNEEHKTPAQIEQELQSAEKQFEKAKKMFNPWYTGPLITPGASMMAPGWGNIQPYLFVTDNYAHFNSERHSHKMPNNLVTLNPSVSMQFGVTKTMDTTLGMQGFENWQNHHSGGGFGDMTLNIGFPVTVQTLHVPAIKLCIKETFPTGQYQHLNTNGMNLSATGGGSYQTQFTLTMSKVLFWDYQHPMNFRLSFNYNLPTAVTVKGFNNYGGGFGTHAKVRPGNTFSADMGIEISLNQRWVVATDLAYTAQNETKYSGYAGTTTKGGALPASIGGGFNDNLSLAPAIEYNWNENLGMLGSVWFSVYGRNSNNFVSGVLSVTWTFQVN